MLFDLLYALLGKRYSDRHRAYIALLFREDAYVTLYGKQNNVIHIS